jgi:Helix-turn-helix domain
VSVAPEVLVTVAEVAARLHKSKRWLQEFLREKPFGRSAGRTRLFTEEDIAAIIDSLPRVVLKTGRKQFRRRSVRGGALAEGAGIAEKAPYTIASLEPQRCPDAPRSLPKRTSPAHFVGQ